MSFLQMIHAHSIPTMDNLRETGHLGPGGGGWGDGDSKLVPKWVGLLLQINDTHSMTTGTPEVTKTDALCALESQCNSSQQS